MRRANPTTRAALTFAWFAVLGCATSRREPVALVPPRIETSLVAFSGSALSGPESRLGEIAVAPEDALVLRLELFYLDRFEASALEPLAEHARLVVGATGKDPFQSIARLGTRTRVATGARGDVAARSIRAASRERAVAVEEQLTALPAGLTVVYSIDASPSALADGSTAPRRIDLELGRAAGGAESGVTLGISFTGAAPAARDDELALDEEMGGSRDAEIARESILLDDALTPGAEPLVLVFQGRADQDRALAVVVAAEPPPTDAAWFDGHRARVAEIVAAARANNRAALERARGLGREELWTRELARTRSALDAPANRRAALVHLAIACRVALVEDVAHSTNDADLSAFALLAIDAIDARGTATEAELGWRLESAVLTRLARAAAADKLPLELDAILLCRAGAAGRWPDVVEDAVRASKDATELEARLVAENRIALEDAAPGSRVRAFDWLAARGAAPAGYDPLGTAAARKRALEAAESVPTDAGEAPR